jgi:hypothetical protein
MNDLYNNNQSGQNQITERNKQRLVYIIRYLAITV